MQRGFLLHTLPLPSTTILPPNMGRNMGRPINRLSARTVASAQPGYYADGGGLYLQVTDAGAKSWVFRYQRNQKRREMGLGPVAVVSLQEARLAAAHQRKVLASGEDPIAARRPAQGASWGDCVDTYLTAHQAGWKNDAQLEQWTNSLLAYGPDRAMPVAAVDTPSVLKCLQPIWTTKTETATRVRGRIERVWDLARVSGYVHGENPARWRGHLDKMLPKPSKVAKRRHHAAMPYADVPALYARLVMRKSRSARALRFTILTAARTEETVGAAWSEFDLVGNLWTIPAERMKAGVEHVVPLIPEAVAILEALPRDAPPFALSENAMLYLLQKHMKEPFTVHGFRSSFRDWVSETTNFPGDLAERALAHVIKDKTVAAYKRGAMLAKRRELMQAWANYVAGVATP
jgi:integrase